VFLVLFRVVSGMTQRATDIGTQLGWTSARHLTNGPFDSETLDSGKHMFEPTYIPHDSELFKDLSGTNEMVSFGLDLSRSASNTLSEGIVHVLPYLLLIVVVLLSSLYQQRQIQGRNTGVQINPQQQAIMRIMPYFLPVFSWAMPAALVVYFVVSNLYRIGQQAYITHSLYSHDESPGAKLARERANRGDEADEKPEGKGRPTPKRNEGRGGRAAGSARAKPARSKRTTPAKPARSKGTGSAKPTVGRGSGRARGAKSSEPSTGAGEKIPKKASPPVSGAGRTGRAPTRHGGGRTTDPTSQQNRKKKDK
jgi:YidC/Oxa1 family membrane protein insertase